MHNQELFKPKSKLKIVIVKKKDSRVGLELTINSKPVCKNVGLHIGPQDIIYLHTSRYLNNRFLLQ